MISNSGDLSSRRSSQGASSQGSQGNSNRIGGSSGETSSTLRNVSGGQTSSQTFSQKVSQSQENSQPSSQPSSIDVLATQAVSSQLFALAAADLQASQNVSQDVSGGDGDAEVISGSLIAADVDSEVSSAAAAVPISQDMFLSPEEPVASRDAEAGQSESKEVLQTREETAPTE